MEPFDQRHSGVSLGPRLLHLLLAEKLGLVNKLAIDRAFVNLLEAFLPKVGVRAKGVGFF